MIRPPLPRPLPPSAPIDGGPSIEKRIEWIGKRPLVVFRKHRNRLAGDFEGDWAQTLSHLDCGPVVELEPSEWVWSRAPLQDFNCHALAVGSSVGLTPTDWLEGKASAQTLHENPTRLLLDQFFLPMATQNSGETPLSPPDAVEENDVFVLRDSRSDHLIHSGFIKWIEEEPLAISKFGEGPILITTLQLLGRLYQRQFDEIQWFRHAGESLLEPGA